MLETPASSNGNPTPNLGGLAAWRLSWSGKPLAPQRAMRCLAAAIAVALLLVTWACTARADDCGSDFGLVGVEAFAMRMPSVPLTVQGADAPPRIAGLASPAGGQTLFGVGADVGVRCDGLLAQLFQLRYAVGAMQSLYGDDIADEASFPVRTGPVHLFELGTPIPFIVSGLGGQVVGDTFKLKLSGAWGYAWAWTDTVVRDPYGAGPWASSMTNQSIYVRAEADACMRLGGSFDKDFASWACLTAAENVYEFDWLSGTSIGVRVDL